MAEVVGSNPIGSTPAVDVRTRRQGVILLKRPFSNETFERQGHGVARFPRINPITEGWFAKQTPIQYVGITIDHCPRCGAEASQDVYVAMLGRHGGVGVPFFLSPLFRRVSTAGKFGERSRWGQCTDCNSVLPHDDVAKAYAQAHGYPAGFLNDPDDEDDADPDPDDEDDADDDPDPDDEDER